MITKSKMEFIVDHVWWLLIFWIWYKSILFRCIGAHSLKESKVILIVMVLSCSVLGLVIDIKKQRNGISVIMNTISGYEVLNRNDLDDCDDSTTALTTETIHFRKGNQTGFSIDVCIVKRDRYGLHRLIHEKTGLAQYDRYYWNLVSNSNRLQEMEEALKPDYWQEVRDTYLNKKNMYLRRPLDHFHPSFVCYIEAVNEVYNNKKWQGLL